jgi:hypothetical protein
MKTFFLTFLSLGSFAAAGSFTITDSDTEIVIKNGPTPVLTYHKGDVLPPPEADPVYIRSGFIHPLHTPMGGVVTGIHPDDHYHHLGLWHAWVKGEHAGKPVDFWNLADKTGRVRFSKVLSVSNDTAKPGIVVEQEAVRYRDGKGGDAVVVLREELSVTVQEVDGAYELDYVYAQTNVTDQPLVLPAYRYGGGLAYRAPLDWNKDNSEYLTSEGKTRADSHQTRARWIEMRGPTSQGKASVTVLCHPKNHDAPQRLRTWDNGKVFLNYVPIQETGWEIPAGKTVTHRYRMVIADGETTVEDLNNRWRRYAEE